MRGGYAFVVAGFMAGAMTTLPVMVIAQEGRLTITSTAPFARVAEALERAVTEEKMGLVCHANAQRAAAGGA
jgi:hypothetical protein